MKYIITEEQYDKVIDRFITHLLEPHEEKVSSDYPGSIFWVKDGEIIAWIKEGENYFWLNYDIWSQISTFLSLEDDEVQEGIWLWLEKHYKFWED
jgi:hypothetical protein